MSALHRLLPAELLALLATYHRSRWQTLIGMTVLRWAAVGGVQGVQVEATSRFLFFEKLASSSCAMMRHWLQPAGMTPSLYKAMANNLGETRLFIIGHTELMRTNTRSDLIELLDPSKLFFYRTELSEDERDALLDLFAQPGEPEARVKNVHFLLCLMHDAMRMDRRRYLSELFLPWTGLKRRTRSNRQAILEDISNLGPTTEHGYARRLVGIYRSIVAELFDPYLTLATATLQFLENKFKNIDDSNVAQSERSKAEFVAARDGFSELLSGYEPLVRNAASHPGSHGVTYRDDSIVFKDISRSKDFKVRRVEWTHEELRRKIDVMNECITSFDLTENVFGLDCIEFILNDTPVRLEFLHQHTSAECRAEFRACTREATRETAGTGATPGAILAAALDALTRNYGDRDMPFTTALQSAPGRMVIVVPIEANSAFASDEEIVQRVQGLLRYGIIAVGCVGKTFHTIDVLEVTEGVPLTARLRVSCDGELLCDYGEEKAGLVDLIDACDVCVGGEQLRFNVDFDRLREVEDEMLGDPYPREARPSPGGRH